MALLKRNSLATTIDAINEAFLFDKPIAKADRRAAAEWIAGRQGQPGSYARLPAPTPRDFSDGLRLFTGRRITTRAATGHILGEEACRALILLDVHTKTVDAALRKSTAGMLARLNEHWDERPGRYCCGACTAALWRHLAAGGLDKCPSRLAAGMKVLEAHRDGQGRWRCFPFHYTLLALTEIDTPAARREMRYAAAGCQRILKRKATRDKYDRRRRTVAERVLEIC